MRAIIRKGASEPPTFDPDHPAPTQSEHPDHYIIRAKAAALTRSELTWEEPKHPDIPVPGFDLAGEIISVPTSTSTHAFQPGDQVFALTDPFQKGNAREITVARESDLALKPKNLSWEEAASVPLSALTAYEALFVHAKLDPPESRSSSGKRVLVTAAAGGVGVWAVQLGHEAGLNITGTCGTSNVDFVKSLGADTVLDYRKSNLLEWVHADFEARSFDVVVDCIGGQTLEDAWKCVKKGGKIIGVAEPPDSKKPAEGTAEGVEGVWFIVKSNGTTLAEIAGLIENGSCKPVVDSVYELEQFEEAFERLEGGHAKGKVVFKLG